MLPHSASVMSSTRRTETPARYISMRVSSTLLSRRRYRSMMAVSKEVPLTVAIWLCVGLVYVSGLGLGLLSSVIAFLGVYC